jgi:SAM-dependent methyltransferase
MPLKCNTPACLLCGHERVAIVDRLSAAQLQRMWRENGDEIPDAALYPLTPEREVCLGQCCSCGFQFFDPSLAGGAAFYECLSRRASYYSAVNADFRRTAAFAKKHNLTRVLDVGCGEGCFLDLLKAAGHQTHGIELNSKAARRCMEAGHRVFSKLQQELTVEEAGGSFDLVTAFQVVEHLAEPVRFISDASRLTRLGGFIAIAVPNRIGIRRLVLLDPHEWPPHHVSRWRPQDLRLLGEQCGLTVIEQGADTTIGSQIRYVMRFNNQMARVIGRQNQLRSEMLIAGIGYLYTLLGMKYWTPHFGSSAYCIYQKTE